MKSENPFFDSIFPSIIKLIPFSTFLIDSFIVSTISYKLPDIVFCPLGSKFPPLLLRTDSSDTFSMLII